MSSTQWATDTVRDLMKDISEAALREGCIEALRRRYRSSPDRQIRVIDGLGRELIPLLAERKERSVEVYDSRGSLCEPFVDNQSEPWMEEFLEFLYWFARAGFAFPLTRGTEKILILQLTRHGQRFLESPEGDHPLLPGFVQRVAKRCPGLPDEVTSLLTDAQTCMDRILMRPALVLMGVAYEIAVEDVFDSLVQQGAISAGVAAKAPKAAARITAVRDAIDTVLPNATIQDRDNRYAARDACDHANALRRRRNDASHTAPIYGFDDQLETEELLVSSGRHLPNLWRLH